MIRVASMSRSSSAIPSASGAIAPTYQSTCASPAKRPRSLGAVSVISVHDAGMSAPTVRPTMKKPTSSSTPGREDDPQRAERVQQQVPLVDLLAAEQVADAAADQRAEAGRDRVRAERAEERDERVTEAEVLAQIGSATAPATIEPASM